MAVHDGTSSPSAIFRKLVGTGTKGDTATRRSALLPLSVQYPVLRNRA